MYSNLCEAWPLQWCSDVSNINPAVTGYAAEAATEILWQATGRQYGNCPVILRPCRKSCDRIWPVDVLWADGVLYNRSSWGWPFPVLQNGLWINLACGLCGDNCSCGTTSEVILDEQVNEITEIRVDGEVVPPGSGWVMYDSYRLVRVDGEWPLCQDWTVTGGPGSWTVEASFGEDLPMLGKLAMGMLTAEIAKACCGGSCDLPASVTRVVRQGVTMEKIRVNELLQEGLTGLWLVDRFILTANPEKLVDRARAYSVDAMYARLQNQLGP